MAKRLPRHPNLGSLRNQAQQLRQAYRNNDADARRRLRSTHPQFTSADPERAIRLSDAQLVIAREYGFDSWTQLKRFAEAATASGPTAPIETIRGRMHRIFPNLYRFDSKPIGKTRKSGHTYLIVRKSGNLLICGQDSLVTEDFDDIEVLGGIHTQLLGSYLDAKKGPYHELLYERFGCQLCYHEDERKMARTKTKCPEVTFGDDGLQLGSDFEAHHFPNRCQTGNSLFRWRHKGTYHLFTSVVVTRRDGEWDVEFNPELWPDKRPQLTKLTRLEADVFLPAMSAEGEEIHHFTERSRKAFRRTLREKLQLKAGGLKSQVRPKRLNVVTNWVAPAGIDSLEATGLFEIDKMKVHGNCAMSLFMTYLERADVMLFHGFRRNFRSDHPYLEALRQHIVEGGGLLLVENRPRAGDREIVSVHPFPEIAVSGKAARMTGNKIPDLVVVDEHPVTRGLALKESFQPVVFEHKDHQHSTYEGRTFEPGPKGDVLLCSSSGDPVLVVGQVGKGRVVMSGLSYGVGGVTEGPERLIWEGALRWLGNLPATGT